ncbi:MAG: tetratricopeptide repeat protein [Bdellovibrio sp.]
MILSRSQEVSGPLWILMGADGQLEGPLATEEILLRIRQGRLSGDELLRPYPDGKWIQLSQRLEFYDEILRVLEGSAPVEFGTPKARIQNEDVAPSSSSPKEDQKTHRINEFQDSPESSQGLKSSPLQKSPRRPSAPSDSASVREQILVSTSTSIVDSGSGQASSVSAQGSETRSPRANLRFPKSLLILLGSSLLLGVLGWALLQKESAPREAQVRLLVPSLQGPDRLAPEQQKILLAEALKNFLESHFDSLVESQNNLVQLLQGAPSHLEAKGLLCLVHKDLWPYSKQDSQDLLAVQNLLQATRAQDPAGLQGNTCQISQLMIAGKAKEARGFVDYVLNQSQFSTSAQMYLLKAELLALEKDVRSASLYAEKSTQPAPQWTKAFFLTAQYASLSGQNDQAARYFEAALKLMPTHKSTLISYGAHAFEKMMAQDKAYELLLQALQSKQKVLRSEEARIYFLLAQISQNKALVRQALEMAEKAHLLQPNNMRIKDFLLKMGGSLNSRKALEANNELVALGDQYARSGDCLSAQAEFKAAFDLDPSNALAALKAGKCLWQLNLSTEAFSWVQKALRADPKLAMAYFILADFHTQRYQFATAAQILSRGSQYLPQNYEILRGYGLLELRRNNFQEAVSYFSRALKIYPNDSDTLVLLADALLQVKDFQNAQASALKAIELDPSAHQGHLIYAEILAAMKGLDTGLRYLQDLIQKFAFTLEYRLGFAELNRKGDRHRQALQVYEQVLLVDPKNKSALLGLSLSAKASGLTDKALRASLDAAVVDPSDAEPLMRAGMIYLDSLKYREAITQFERALRINPLFPLGNYWIGKTAFLAGDLDLALRAAMNERQLNPNLPQSYVLAAEIYTAQRDYAKCTQEFQKALKLQPQNAENYVKIARCYRLSGSPDIAESMLNLAIRQESGRAEIYREQGSVFEQKSDKRSAVEAYNKYLTLSPNAPDRKEIEFKIQELGGSVREGL